MKDFPKISDAEWEVTKILWRSSPLTSSEIIKELKKTSSWSPKTIHTLINRLVEKEVIKVEKVSPSYLYSPLVPEEECKRYETDSFIKKVYNGSVKMLLSNFIKEEKLTEEDINELKNMLQNNK